MSKYNQHGQVIRRYKVKCPHCGQKTAATYDIYDCDVCGKVFCPNCLKTKLVSSSGSSTNGNWYTLECDSCHYVIEDY